MQILHYFGGKQQLNRFLLNEKNNDWLKGIKLESKRLKTKNFLLNFDSLTTTIDLWRFGGFFYNLKYIKLYEIKNFLLFHGANEVIISDVNFLKKLVVFFSFFDRESFLLFFFRYITVFELYFLFGSFKFTYFDLYRIVYQFNYKLVLLSKIHLLRVFFFKKKKKINYIGYGSFKDDIYFFFYYIRYINNSLFQEFKQLTSIFFFIDNVSKNLVNSLYSFYDIKMDTIQTFDLFYNGFNLKNLKSKLKKNYNFFDFILKKYKNSNFIKLFLLGTNLNLNKFFDIEMSCLYEFNILINIFFFKIIKLFLLFKEKKFNIYIYILNKLYKYYLVKFNLFSNFIFNFNKFIKNESFNFFLLLMFCINFNFIFSKLFFVKNKVEFLQNIKYVYFFIKNLYLLYFYFKFLSNLFQFSIIDNNFFFIVYTLKNLIFKNYKILVSNGLVINNCSNLYNFQNFFINFFNYKLYIYRILYRFSYNILESTFNFFFKLYLLFIFKYKYYLLKFENFFKFFKIFLTKRTLYNYTYINSVYVNNGNNFLKDFEIKIYFLLYSFRFSLKYPYYYILYNILNFNEKYLYLPFKYRFGSLVESFFLLINSQNFSEGYEEDVDNSIYEHQELIDLDDLMEEESDEIDEVTEYTFDYYSENDWFALYFIEDLNSFSYYITNIYNLKFGLSDQFFFNEFVEFDNIFLSIDFLQNELNLLSKNYLENFNLVIKFYSFFTYFLNKYFFFQLFLNDFKYLINNKTYSNLLNFFNIPLYRNFYYGDGTIFFPNFWIEVLDFTAFNFFSYTNKYKYKLIPFLLDLSWWWEVWFLKQYKSNSDFIVSNLNKEENNGLILLKKLVSHYLNSPLRMFINFEIKDFFVNLQENTSLYNFINLVLDDIFLCNIQKNFYLYYQTKFGYKFLIYQIYFFINYIYLNYKELENLLFYDFTGFYSDGINEGLWDEKVINFIDEVDIKEKTKDDFEYIEYYNKIKIDGSDNDISLGSDESPPVLFFEHEIFDKLYLYHRYLLNGYSELVVLNKKYIKNINDYLFFCSKQKNLYSVLNISTFFNNVYKLNFNVISSELYISELYYNFAKGFTEENNLEENYNYYNDYNLKFFSPEEENYLGIFYDKLMFFDLEDEYSNSLDDFASDEDNYRSFIISIYKNYLNLNKFSLEDFRISEELNMYFERLNSLNIKMPYQIIFFENKNLFSDLLNFLNKKCIYNLKINKVLLIFWILIKKNILKFKNKFFIFVYFYFKLFFKFLFKCFINLKNNLIIWLFYYHFIIYKIIINKIHLKSYLIFFFFFFTNIFFFFLLKNLKIKDRILFNKKNLNFLSLFLVKIILNLSVKEQILIFKNVVCDINKFLFFFFKSLVSYYYFTKMLKIYIKIFKLGLVYNFFFLLLKFFIFFISCDNKNIFFYDKHLKNAFFYLNLYDLDLSNSLRTYVTTLLIYYTDEEIFFSQLNEIDYLKWLCVNNQNVHGVKNNFNIYELKQKLLNLYKNFNINILYNNIYFSKQLNLNSFDDIYFNFNYNNRYNYDKSFIIDTELVDVTDINLEQKWDDFELDEVDFNYFDSNNPTMGRVRNFFFEPFPVIEEDMDIDEWENPVDQVGDDEKYSSDDFFSDIDFEEFDFELDLSNQNFFFLRNTLKDYTSIPFESFKFPWGKEGNNSNRFLFLIDMFLNRNLEILRNLLLFFFFKNRTNFLKFFQLQNFKKLVPKMVFQFSDVEIEKILKLNFDFLNINKSLLIKEYLNNDFFENLDYLTYFNTDISEFGSEYKNYDVFLGIPLSDMQQNYKYNEFNLFNFYRYIQIFEINQLNFNLMLQERIIKQRLYYLIYEFKYLKNNLNYFEKINIKVNFFEYVNLHFKKLINFYYKGLFLKFKGQNFYNNLPIFLTNEVYIYMYKKNYFYLYKKYKIYNFFKNLYFFYEKKDLNKFKNIINIIKNKFFYKFKFTNDELLNLLTLLFKNKFLSFFSFDHLNLVLKRIFFLYKKFGVELSFLGLYFLEELYDWFFSMTLNLSLFINWKYLLYFKNLIKLQENFLFYNKYNLFQIYLKYDLLETLFYFNNKLLETQLSIRVKKFSMIYIYYNFLKQFSYYIILSFILFILTLNLFDLPLFTQILSIVGNYLFNMSLMQPLDGLFGLPLTLNGEGLLYREFRTFMFDAWGWF